MTEMTRRRLVPWLIYLLTLVSAWPVGAILARDMPKPDGGCSGIGFGCSLYGWDAAAFVLLLVGVPFAAALAVLLALLSFLPLRFGWVTTTVAAAGLAVPWAAVVVAVASTP